MDEQDIQAQREQKQRYLIDEIIEGGHDPAQFKEYLDNLKPDGGSNVDVWAMQELVEVVDCFKKGVIPHFNQASQGYEQPENYQEETKVVESVKQEEPIKQKSQAISLEVKSEDDRYNKVLKCQAVNRTALNDEPDAEIFVGDPELIKGGLFTPSYIVYKVTTKPYMWIVKRRFSDFFWLRAHLTKMYPHLMVPPIPKKKNKGKFENEFISRRMAFLEKFMNSCLQNEEIKADQTFLAFVQLEDENKFKAKKKIADALKRPVRLEETEKLDGEMILQIGPELRDFAQHASEFVYQSEPLYKKMRKCSKQLLLDFDQLSNTLFNMGECFGQMYTVSNNFNKHSPMGQNHTLDDIYLTLNNLMVSWGEQMLGEMKIVQHGLSNFFKYSHSEFEPMKEALKQRTTLAADFLKFKRALDAKKEKSFTLGEISKWDIPSSQLKGINQADLLKDKELAFSVMFPKESIQELEMRDRFAYFNFETFSEFSAAVSKRCKAYLKNFQQFAKDQSENLSSVHIHWADGLAHFSDASLIGHAKNTVLKDRTNVQKPSDKDGFHVDESMLAGADAE